MNKLYFIAELGQNHQGDIKIAKQMIDMLVGTGVAAVKTAKRDIDCFPEWKDQIYDNPHSFGHTYYDHRKALELSFENFLELKNYSELNGFDFIPSFTDIPSFDFLMGINVNKIKIASQRVIDKKLLVHVAKNFSGPVYMSTGMSKFSDVDFMVETFKKNEKYLMQCTSAYPCSMDKIDLRVLKKYRKRYKKRVNDFGVSGHYMSIIPDIVAYSIGARIIERHFTINRKWKGSDHAGALEIQDIKKLMEYIKEADLCLGNSLKDIHPEEKAAMKKLRSDLK